MSNVILLHLKLCILSQPMKLKPEKFISNNVAIGLGTSRHFEKKNQSTTYVHATTRFMMIWQVYIWIIARSPIFFS